MSTPQQHRLIGQVIAGRYQVVELLAEGGMGAVYIADHLTLHKQVALKIVHPEHAGNAELSARFAREAMATSRIDHPNVISAMDCGQLPDGTAFLAVQLVRGPSLSRVLTDQGGLPWPRVASIGAQIADALCAAHGHGIVHRDLKPDNVLLQGRDDGTELVKVLDFGVAKFAPESQVPLSARTDVTQIGMVVGTPGYMAPEQTIGNPADERSDLYALGVMLWESLVGRPLWSAPDMQSLVEKQMSELPAKVRLATGDPTIPAELEELVAALLSRRAEERPPDAAAVRDALRRFVSGHGDATRWRTGERPAPRRLPDSGDLTLPLEPSLALPEPTPLPVREERSVATEPPLALASLAPAPPSIRSRRRLRSSRAAWAVTALLGALLALPIFLVATGRLELKPKGEMLEVAERMKELALTPPPTDPGPSAAELDAVASDSGLPVALASAFAKLAIGNSRDQRAAGADEVLAHQPEAEVPAYLRHMALLQRAKTCAQKREQVLALSELGEPRSLPLLRWLAERPRTGCGRRKREDCLGCLRKPLGALLRTLEQGEHALP